MPPTIWTWICPALCMRSTRRPSICVCRCFLGRIFVRRSLPLRRRGAAVKMHTLLDLRGNIPSFIVTAQVPQKELAQAEFGDQTHGITGQCLEDIPALFSGG